MSIGEKQEKINTSNDGESRAEESEIFDLVPAESKKEKLRTILIYMAILILASSASYGIGRISFYNSNKVPVEIKTNTLNLITSNVEKPREEGGVLNSVNTASVLNSSVSSSESNSGIVVGSKKSDKYHYPWCSGAKNISEANKITFSSIEEARASGYVPASNCKGLK